jgi:hypothetical protein
MGSMFRTRYVELAGTELGTLQTCARAARVRRARARACARHYDLVLKAIYRLTYF